MEQVVKMLRGAANIDYQTSQNALRALGQMEEEKFDVLVGCLATILESKDAGNELRQRAGLQLKNSIFSEDDMKNRRLHARWLYQSEDVRTKVKKAVFFTLADSNGVVRNVAAVTMANIISIELPVKGKWPDAVKMICENASKENELVKMGCYRVLGELCALRPEGIEQFSSRILAAISKGMVKEQKSDEVKLEAIRALVLSLEFADNNMKIKDHRRGIVEMVFAGCSSKNAKIRENGFRCLLELGISYYDYLKDYIGRIFSATMPIIRDDKNEDIVKLALEFWIALFKEEDAVLQHNRKCREQKLNNGRTYLEFALSARQGITPLLLRGLHRQSADPESDRWTVADTSADCLQSLAKVVGNRVVQPVLDMFEKNIASKNWRERDAALVAFGCIIKGPDAKDIDEVVRTAFPAVLNCLKSDHAVVQDSAAWCTLTILENFCFSVAGTPEKLGNVINACLYGLQSQRPHVVMMKMAACVHRIAKQMPWTPSNDNSNNENKWPLADSFKTLAENLFRTATATGNYKVARESFHALSRLIESSSPAVSRIVVDILPHLRKTLLRELERQAKGEEVKGASDIQSLIISTLEAIIIKFSAKQLERHCASIMALLFDVLKVKQSAVHEEVFMAISAMLSSIGNNFANWVDPLMPFLRAALSDYQSAHVCGLAVMVVGDLARAFGSRMPMPKELLFYLLQIIHNNDAESVLKPKCIDAIADMAIALGFEFRHNVVSVMQMLEGAGKMYIKDPNPDDVEYMQQVKESVIMCYAGVIHAFRENSTLMGELYNKYLQQMIGIFDFLMEYPVTATESSIGAAANLIGDMAAAGLTSQQRDMFKRNSVNRIISSALSSNDEEVKEGGEWGKSQLTPNGS